MPDFLQKLPLTKWFLDHYEGWKHSKFPGGGAKTNYADVLTSTHNFLNANVHNRVETRAAAVEGSLLTDHGPEHIKMVMRRAQFLIATAGWAENDKRKEEDYQCCLSPYEVFLLLMAIHFHDVGNIYGREGHERRIADEMEKVPCLQTLDGFEQGVIAQIARCHGGKINNDPDTIGKLPVKNEYGTGVEYRPQLLAAVLRFADELADDRSRADTYGLQAPGQMPEKSVIFHKYAAALASVYIDAAGQEIRLKFELTKDDVVATYPFKEAQKYIIEYIRERVQKTHAEMLYCSQYMRRLECHFHQVAVNIEVRCGKRDFEPAATIAFRIGNVGYPEQPGNLEMAQSSTCALDGGKLAEAVTEKCSKGTAFS